MPARSIPVPDTVSPQFQKMIAVPVPPNWRDFPKTAEEWKKQADDAALAAVRNLPTLREQLYVRTEATTIDGVPVFIVTPDMIPSENRNRLLIHVHGGCYVSNPGESGTIEAILVGRQLGPHLMEGDFVRQDEAATQRVGEQLAAQVVDEIVLPFVAQVLAQAR